MINLIILKNKKVIFSFIAIFLVTSAALAEDSIIKIGVLAKRGPERCIEKWSPTAEYLSNKIPEKTFVIVPVDYNQTYSVVEKSEVDFILANSSLYVELETWYGINRIATLKNEVFGGSYTKFGGVIFCKKQREDIRQYADLKGKTFMAVEETSFAGWRMAWRELKEAGIDPFKDFTSMNFGGTHDAVVYAVRDGKVDAGTVRTDTLERMNAEGKIRIDDFHVIHEHGGGNVHLPFSHSTREYPEWPIAKLKHTSNEVAEKVAVALIGMPQDSAAAQAARCAGWTIPLNYQSVHDCLKELKVGPYKDFGKITLTDIFRKYRILILFDLATLVILAWFLATHIILNRKIKTAYKELEIEVNERMEAEKALQSEKIFAESLITTAQAIILVLDKEGRVIRFNPYMEEITGYKIEEVQGKEWFTTFLPFRNHRRIRELFLSSLSDIQVRGNINPIITKDRREIEIEWHDKTLKDAQDNVIGLIAVGQDVTERRRLEKELLKAHKLESLGVFAGGIAHDFNNILTMILGNVSLAKSQVTPEDELFDLLSEAEMASTRAQTLTRQLLTFAKGGAPVKETASIKDILKESSSFVLRGSKSDCEFSIPENLWPAEVDVGQISQVINNIVINANQAMPKGGIIQIAADNLIVEDRHGLPVKAGKYVRISIKDQGVGIAEKHLLNIFDPYFTTKHAGSGLGLATTYSIIKRHDGHITVESRLEVGTTFHIYLPASDKAVLEKEKALLIKGRGRILVMDDQAPLRKIFGRMLKNLGYESEFAKDGAEAIRMVKKAKESEKPYDAAILDLTVPGGMGGKEAINKLLEIDPEVKAIVSSGYSDDPVLANFQEYGFKGMMSKPFESLTLSKVLHEVLHGKGKD